MFRYMHISHGWLNFHAAMSVVNVPSIVCGHFQAFSAAAAEEMRALGGDEDPKIPSGKKRHGEPHATRNNDNEEGTTRFGIMGIKRLLF